MATQVLEVKMSSDFERSLKETLATLAERMAESDAKIAESRRETDAKIAESEAVIAAAVKRMDERDGRWGNRIGDLTEMILVPGIRPVMKRLGHEFPSLSPNRKFYITKGQKTELLTEVDLYLENGIESMAVEIKTTLLPENVDYHLQRLAKMRKHEGITSLKGKTLLGAMAGLEILEDARELALERGLYVIEIIEDANHVNVVEPPAGVRGW